MIFLFEMNEMNLSINNIKTHKKKNKKNKTNENKNIVFFFFVARIEKMESGGGRDRERKKDRVIAYALMSILFIFKNIY